MPKEAMRTAQDVPVFVRDDGEYTTEFPRQHIVRKNASDSEESVFITYGFVGENDDYETGAWLLSDEKEAIEVASEEYGSDVSAFSYDGEVFEVEVHEISVSAVEDHLEEVDVLVDDRTTVAHGFEQ